MKLSLLENKKVDKVDYLTKKQLADILPINDFPSVTTVLKDPKQDAIFRALLKDKNSELSKSVKRGTAAHKAFETGEVKDKLTQAVVDAFAADILPDLDEVYGQEQWVAHPTCYKGKFDLLCVYQGKLTLADYKKTNKRKTHKAMESYYSQLMAYKQAHEYLYPNHPIEQVAIFNIFGKQPEEVDTNVTVLTDDEMDHYLGLFDTKLHEWEMRNSEPAHWPIHMDTTTKQMTRVEINQELAKLREERTRAMREVDNIQACMNELMRKRNGLDFQLKLEEEFGEGATLFTAMFGDDDGRGQDSAFMDEAFGG